MTLLFFKLGLIGFGGPAHIRRMHAEVVKRRKWLLYGIKPVIIARALWDLGKKALKGWLLPLGLAVAGGLLGLVVK